MSKLLLFAGVLAFACTSQAARVPSDALAMLESFPQSILGFQGAAKPQANSHDETSAAAEVVGNIMASAPLSDLEMMLATNEHVNKGDGKWPIQVVTKFLVKPDTHINFVHRWWSYNARTEEEKGVLSNSLSKVAGDNIVWRAWTVYDGVEAAFKHLKSEAMRDFGAFLMDTNIPVEYHLVIPIRGCDHKEGTNLADCFARDDAAGADLAFSGPEDNKKRRSWPVRVSTLYIVPPRDAHEFIGEFGKMAEALEDTKGKLALHLHKRADDNTQFWSYSAWESYEALGKAVHTGAVRDFLQYITDKDIVVVNKKLWRVPAHHPEISIP